MLTQLHEPQCTFTWDDEDVRTALLRAALLRILQFPWSIAHSTAVPLATNVQQKTLKGLTDRQIPSLYFCHSSPYVTSNPCSYFAPVPVFRTSSVFSLTRHRCILPIASLPSSTFPCKIIPLYFYNVVFHCSPYWMKQCVPRLHFPKGEGARCNLFGAHPSTRLVLCVAYSLLARSAGHNVQIINWSAKAIIWEERGEAWRLQR